VHHFGYDCAAAIRYIAVSEGSRDPRCEMEYRILPEILSREETIAAVKQAITEWLDAKFNEFSRWTVKGVACAILAAIVLFIVQSEMPRMLRNIISQDGPH
jgi:hypothetical protein